MAHSNAPVVMQRNKMIYSGPYNNTHRYQRDVYLDESSFTLNINPAVLSLIDHYEASYSLAYYEKFQNVYNWREDGPGGATSHPESAGPNFQDNENIIHLNFTEVAYSNKTNDPQDENGDIWMPLNAVNNHYVVKVTVKLFPKAPYNTEPIVLTRSYLPNYTLFAD
ncbi:hypothetical protein [Mucilaginibacter terrae]|uniref:Uncharacterized protein n=1 Tax=Mucilaginibacter terrae TaxID=1955052 RepID=A0ABU3H0C5_9SPHI|nr:hypothetical protein [Mucilaginibacter terrae]MDT3405462.1 hypothetical protein [Mucilaginibacter terrae]